MADQGDDLGAAIIRAGTRLAERNEPPTAQAVHDALKAEGFDPPSVAEIHARAAYLLRVKSLGDRN
jgi:hypothetical protein